MLSGLYDNRWSGNLEARQVTDNNFSLTCYLN